METWVGTRTNHSIRMCKHPLPIDLGHDEFQFSELEELTVFLLRYLAYSCNTRLIKTRQKLIQDI